MVQDAAGQVQEQVAGEARGDPEPGELRAYSSFAVVYATACPDSTRTRSQKTLDICHPNVRTGKVGL